MNCSSCKIGVLEQCLDELTLDMDGELVTLHEVPVEKCSNCGTVFYDVGGEFEGDYSI